METSVAGPGSKKEALMRTFWVLGLHTSELTKLKFFGVPGKSHLPKKQMGHAKRLDVTDRGLKKFWKEKLVGPGQLQNASYR